jgi:hypothetical protein
MLFEEYGGAEEFANGGFNETRGLITCVGKNIGVGGCTSVEKNNVVIECEALTQVLELLESPKVSSIPKPLHLAFGLLESH